MTAQATELVIDVRDGGGTYTASTPGTHVKTSCTAGPSTAAFRHAMKVFGLKYEETEDRLSIVETRSTDQRYRNRYVATLKNQGNQQ